MAIPPGYASSIWPPAGIALIGVLIGGMRVWPGIWLGSVLVNVWATFNAATPSALLTSAVILASLGLGATVQALLGAWLVRYTIGFPTALTQVREILLFLFLGGPLSCLLSASLGVTTLALNGIVPWGQFGVNWQTWWAGDTIGVLIMAPLILSWLAEPRPIWRRRRLSVGLPMMGALALAVVVFGLMRGQERERLELLFERQATTLAQTLQGRLDDSLDVLLALENFYATAPVVSRQAFHRFVQRPLARHPGLQALSWDRRVLDGQRQAYEEAVQEEGYSNFQITDRDAHGELVRARAHPAQDIGVRAGFGFPVVIGKEVVAVLEFFTEEAREPDGAYLDVMANIGTQLGRVFERQRAEEALRASERKFRSVVESASDAIVVADSAGRILAWNKGAQAIFGYDEAEILGQSLTCLMPARYREPHHRGLERFQTTGRSRVIGHTVELHGLRKDGEEFPIELALSNWKVGADLCYSGIIRDVTVRQQAAEAIRALNETLEQRVIELSAANQELAAFSYSVAHDLRAPPRAIHSFSHIVLEDYAPHLDAEAQGYLQRVSTNALRMGQLIDDLLAFAQLSQQPLRKQQVAPAALVHEALDDLRLAYDHRQVYVSIGDLPVCQADPALLKQVWVNLLANAFKFTRERPVARIQVGSHENQGKCIYFVRDNGVGFDMQYADKLFGVFQRLHSAAQYEGTGVGLALAQRIIQRHGGRIWVEAAVDHGTTFSFTLGK